jgi:hypothetical protein
VSATDDATSECDCIKQVNADLAQHNCAIVTTLFGKPRAFVETYVIKPKRGFRAPKMRASYCPFCGAKYPESGDAA